MAERGKRVRGFDWYGETCALVGAAKELRDMEGAPAEECLPLVKELEGLLETVRKHLERRKGK